MLSRSLLRPFWRLQRSPLRILILCAAGVCAAGLISLFIPRAYFMSLISLPFIIIAVRYGGRRAGLLLCFLAAAFWAADVGRSSRLVLPHSTSWWHLLEKLALFLFITYLVDTLLAGAKRSGKLLAHERRNSKAKSEMLSLVSHELNNSMTMVSLAVHQLEAGGQPAASRKKICDVINRNVTRMSSVAKNFLCEARVASGHLTLRLASQRLDRIVSSVVDSLGPLADAKEIDVAWSVAPRDLTAIVDADALGVVLTNLVGNAIKYTPNSGRVAVRVRPAEGLPRRVSVCVEDNGIGIAAADQERVVAGFERTEAGQKNASGFGLGLKIAHDIIKAHGGALAIASRERDRGFRSCCARERSARLQQLQPKRRDEEIAGFRERHPLRFGRQD